MYKDYKDQGFTVLGFYSNQFMNQGGTVEQQIKYENTHGVEFPVFGIVNVNPPDEHPVFSWLKSQPQGGGKVGWNFTKWLVGRDGTVIGRWESNVDPKNIRPAIEDAL
jgi:glutathione peroxidase